MSAPLPHLEDAQQALVRHFGLAEFRTGQAEVVDAVLSGRNVVVVMPTGAGKSLCYQLPAMLLDGLTLVVSPLISLMKDQVDQLTARGIKATFLNSSLTDLERQERMRGLRQGEYKLLYVAPERLRSAVFLEMLQGLNVQLFAIDEAHCISQWGHDFRPDYAGLGRVRKALRPPRTVALTATATPEVQEDITRSLLMKDPKVFVAGFDRPNLFLQVTAVSGDDERAAHASQWAGHGGSGIVYCATRKAAERLHTSLTREGHDAILYHAGLNDSERREAQEAFMAQDDVVAVATNAFGMGIDKPNIRFVLHANIPRAVEAYYQEIGRAGRDRKPAHAVLLFNHADVFTQQRMIESSHPSEVVFSDLWNTLVSLDGPYEKGQAALAGAIGCSEQEVSAAVKVLEREGLLSISVSGERHHRHILKPLSSVSFTELGFNLDRVRERERRSLLMLKRMTDYAYTQRCRRQYLLRYFGEETGQPRCGGCDVCTPPPPVRLAPVRATPPTVRKGKGAKKVAAPIEPGDYNELAATELRRFRRDLARDLEIAPFVLFNDKTLFALARALPTKREEFLAVSGASEKRWERFGPSVVEICVSARATGR
jgi:ATP-dependent DNA helicase RecQ